MNLTFERFLQPFITSPGRGRGSPIALLERLLTHLQVAQERRHLASLDEHMLRDIGISRADAMAESGRSFWDIPPDR